MKNEMSPKKTFIHIGFPKTATTSLQLNLLARHPEIFQFGAHGNDNRMTNVLAMIKSQDTLDYSQADVSRLVAEILDHHLLHGRSVVVSDEFLTVTYVPHYTAMDRTLIAQRLRATFGPAKIWMTIRRQRPMLESMYSQWMKWYGKRHLSDQDFETWVRSELDKLQTSFLSMINYYPVYRVYGSIFGYSNVKVFMFERLAQDSSAFAADICRYLDVSVSKGSELLNLQRYNPRLTQWGYLRQILSGRSAVLKQMIHQSASHLPTALKQKIKRAVPTRPLLTVLSAQTSDRLFRYFAKDNAELARETGLNLQDYGYF
jgi:hypothetical protein